VPDLRKQYELPWQRVIYCTSEADIPGPGSADALSAAPPLIASSNVKAVNDRAFAYASKGDFDAAIRDSG